jgi:hypothetical protein
MVGFTPPPCDAGVIRAAPAVAVALSQRRKQLTLAATILGSSMAFIDGSVVNIALPAIQQALHADAASTQWIVNGYLLLLGSGPSVWKRRTDTRSTHCLGCHSKAAYRRWSGGIDASGCESAIRTRRRRIRPLARGSRAGQVAGSGMVVGPGVRTARRAPADARSLVFEPWTAGGLILCRGSAGVPRFTRRPDIADVARRFPGPGKTHRSRLNWNRTAYPAACLRPDPSAGCS